MEASMSLKDKVAIVTGGGSGIGRAASLHLANEGAIIAIGDVVLDSAMATATDIIKAGGRAMYGNLDVSDASSVKAFVDRVFHQYQKVDILINNAGGMVSPTNVLDCAESDWDRTFVLNVKGVFLMSRTVLPLMIQNKKGSIINVGSAAGLVGRKNMAAYSASKGAIIALTRAMAHDHGRDGVRINCVCPGPTITPAFLRTTAATTSDLEAELRVRKDEQPLGRLGEPADIAEAILFLASDRASWITGIVLPIDGGNTAI
jgi:meso-butanediol dehydrogenase/(S,S)-butanediol dehydrogenase/diacetyl reductase